MIENSQKITPENIPHKENHTEKKEEFSILNDPEQRKLLAEKVMELVEQVSNENIKNLVYLDKSARPISTLFIDLWKKRYPDKELPLINFINVGTETGAMFKEKLGDDYMSRSYTDDKRHDEFLKNLSDNKILEVVGEDKVKEIKDKYSYLSLAKDGTIVQLVEEYSNTGESMSLAKRILETAFPKLRFVKYSLQEQEGEDDKEGGLSLFEVWRDPDDKEKGTKYEPPWRHIKSDKDYGITGVVDSKEASLIARPYYKISVEERIGTIEQKTQQKEEKKMKIDKEYLPILKEQLIKFSEKTELFIKELPTLFDDQKQELGEKLFEIIKTEFVDKLLSILNEALMESHNLINNLNSNKVDLEKFKYLSSQIKSLSEKVEDDYERHKIEKILKEKNNLTSSESWDIGIALGMKTKVFRELEEELVSKWLLSEKINIEKELKKLQETKSEVLETDYKPDVNKLRKELHMVADEYWIKKQI